MLRQQVKQQAIHSRPAAAPYYAGGGTQLHRQHVFKPTHQPMAPNRSVSLSHPDDCSRGLIRGRRSRGYRALVMCNSPRLPDPNKGNAWKGLIDFKKQAIESLDAAKTIVMYGEMAQATYDSLDVKSGTIHHGWGPSNLLQKSIQGHSPVLDTAGRYSVCDLLGADVADIIAVKKATDTGPAGIRGKLLAGPVRDVLKVISNAAIKQIKPPDAPAQQKQLMVGYAAISNDEKDKDVVFVFRGTIFKEEWQLNIEENEMVAWKGHSRQPVIEVHRGFYNIYFNKHKPAPGFVQNVLSGNVSALQQNLINLFQQKPPVEAELSPVSPREDVKLQLHKLLKDNDVATVTTTGHSLGGAMCVLAAVDIKEVLDENWKDWGDEKSGFVTKRKPTVRAFAFASPRVGNLWFQDHVQNLQQNGLQVLRISNAGDMVPKVPGLITTTWTWLSSFWSKPVPQLKDLLLLENGEVDTERYKFLSKTMRQLRMVCPFFWNFYHVGDRLLLDSKTEYEPKGNFKALQDFDLNDFGPKHNLEAYLYLVERNYEVASGWGPRTVYGKGPLGRPLSLVNKSDDILKESLGIPARHWTP